ncbi:hypothetical protein FOTG_11687 [Fusarium oxysporum f. sp. vasinfectum 25433]|uniref:Mesaconyl-C4 CoA hydratase n=1 Tax=Fusarium oxysporum f. sp. vasinfectum 25433 TaxID=1089449 RepID=X0MID5_FUSOX|nr:hypothetical protein FOTG_11687 [Fusarium oxysporum f. sp. vasinfectum 25433]
MVLSITLRPSHVWPLLRLRHKRYASTSAAEAAKQLMAQFEGQVSKRQQILDGNQLQKLSLTLNRKELHPGLDISESGPPNGTALPPGYHLVYFTPSVVESDLGLDGTDTSFNAPLPFTRRMWAGGRIQWFDGKPLCIGEEVEERTRLLSAEPKQLRDGSDMVLVNVEKSYWGKMGLSLKDQRSWVFRRQIPTSIADMSVSTRIITERSEIHDIKSSQGIKRNLSWSPASLFRFSALTFNSHRIHYDAAWSQGVEKHAGLVVHGPLNLIAMLDYWRDCHKGVKSLAEISYRATAPIYAGEQYVIGLDLAQEIDGKCQATVKKGNTLCMKGDITFL